MEKRQIEIIDITWADGECQTLDIGEDIAVVLLTTDKAGEGTGIIVANELALHILNKRFIDFILEGSEMAQAILAAFALAMVPTPSAEPSILQARGPMPNIKSPMF